MPHAVKVRKTISAQYYSTVFHSIRNFGQTDNRQDEITGRNSKIRFAVSIVPPRFVSITFLAFVPSALENAESLRHCATNSVSSSPL
jgi:hypothetical protein